MIKRIVILQDESLVIREMSRARTAVPAYAGVGVGALLVILAVTGAGIVLGLIGAIVLLVSGWATRALRDL